MSFELEPNELEAIRDNLAKDIEDRTELLKSIVKDKYRDILEAGGAIQRMKSSLKEVEQSLWSLDKGISDFYTRIKQPKEVIEAKHERPLNQSNKQDDGNKKDVIKRVFYLYAEIWEEFDSNNLNECVKKLNISKNLLKSRGGDLSADDEKVARKLEVNVARAEEMIKNSLQHKVLFAEADQIGIIAGSDQEELYQVSLDSSIEFLVETLRRDLSNTSYHAQIRRYQPQSYFNTETNEMDQNFTDFHLSKSPATGYVQIPKLISPELSAFLYGVCKVVNTIAGFNLSRSSIVGSLKITIGHILEVYDKVISAVEILQAESKRKRALQLYFDLLYVRILLNTSKNIDLIEQLDPKLTDLASKYEPMLDSVELYMISPALHANVMNLSKQTIRLYGLLIPHLE